MTTANDTIETFLNGKRLATLTTSMFPGRYPVPRPVWFQWDNGVVKMFSAANAPKVGRLQQNNHATLLVANEVAEPEFWVALHGKIEVAADGALDTVEQLAERYWGSTPNESKTATLQYWRTNAERLVALRLTVDKITSGAG